MDKKQFAETVAEGVFRFRGMNQCWLGYNVDKELFFFQSSLTPVYDNEIIVDRDCSADSFGIDTDTISEEELEDSILDGCWDEYWHDVIDKIEYA